MKATPSDPTGHDQSHESVDLNELATLTYSAVFSDICDQMGYRSQTAQTGLEQLAGEGTLVGWARTFRSIPVHRAPTRPYGGEIDFVDSLSHGDVAIGQAEMLPAASWGELFSTAAVGRGARGVVVNGWLRDVEQMRRLPFHAFGRGTRPTDSLGRISLAAQDETIEFDGVSVSTGDLVVADVDGVTIVPAHIATDAIGRALEKASTETSARGLLLAGGKLADVWERYRVL